MCFQVLSYMYKKPTSELLPFDPEIKKTLRNLKKSKGKQLRMEDNQSDRYNKGHSCQNDLLAMREPTLGDCWKSMVNENDSGIRRQTIEANNFELKLSLISMVQQQQFGGHPSEDLNGHLSNFLQLCGTIKMNRVDHNVIKLMFFPFSLKEKERNWFHNLTQGSIETWGEMVEAFLTNSQKYLSLGNQNKRLLYDAWDHFRELLRKWAMVPSANLLQWEKLFNKDFGRCSL